MSLLTDLFFLLLMSQITRSEGCQCAHACRSEGLMHPHDDYLKGAKQMYTHCNALSFILCVKKTFQTLYTSQFYL